MIQCHSLWILPPCPMIPHPWKPEFLTLCPTDIWGQVMRCVGGCPVHCRILSSTPGFYPPFANSDSLPSCINQKLLPNVPWGTKTIPG